MVSTEAVALVSTGTGATVLSSARTVSGLLLVTESALVVIEVSVRVERLVSEAGGEGPVSGTTVLVDSAEVSMGLVTVPDNAVSTDRWLAVAEAKVVESALPKLSAVPLVSRTTPGA